MDCGRIIRLSPLRERVHRAAARWRRARTGQFRSVRVVRPLVLVSLLAPMEELPVALGLEPASLLGVLPVVPPVGELPVLPVPLAPMLVPLPVVLPGVLLLSVDEPLPVVLLPAAEVPVLGVEPPVLAPAPVADGALEPAVPALPAVPAAPDVPEPLL